MIRELHVTGIRSLLDVRAKLTPLHVFVGPCGAGKTALLATLARTCNDRSGAPYLRDGVSVSLTVPDGDREVVWTWARDRSRVRGLDALARFDPALVRKEDFANLRTHACRATRLCLSEIAMCLESTDIGVSPSEDTLSGAGGGLPLVLNTLANRDPAVLDTIAADLREWFHDVRSVGTVYVPWTRTRKLAVQVCCGTDADGRELCETFDGDRMSSGMLHALALVTLRHCNLGPVLCIEHPDRGLHPALVEKMLVPTLRRVVERGTQVLVETHSPLVLNAVKPEEVSIVTRTAAEGTRVTRMVDVPDFAVRSSVFSLGELWLAYCDGSEEKALLTPAGEGSWEKRWGSKTKP